SGSSWLWVTPFGIRKMMNWFKYNYNNIPVYITENGVSDKNATLYDYHRVHFYRLYISEVLKAIRLDGCNVKGYTAWSLMDNMEWNAGYSEKFGIHYVNFSDPERPRTPKASAIWYKTLIADHGFKHGFTQPGGWGTAPELLDDFYYGTFPKDFKWAAATAAYQIEGGWNADGKGPSNWDAFTHEPGNIDGGDTGDVACDSYNKYMEDVRMLQDLGVTDYRFSISWSRVLPDGTLASRNQAGIDYYHKLIDALLAANIKPMVTLYHWDLPNTLQEKGGWLNESIIPLYKDYADLCFTEYGDKAKLWITFNEPWVFTALGYGSGEMAPGRKNPATEPYIAAHTVLKAHAEVYHLYNDTYRAKQKGVISITLNCDWAEPKDPVNEDDLLVSDNALQTFIGWFAHPIYVNGDYPQVMKDLVSNASQPGNSRLPVFTQQEKDRIVHTFDFFGLNHYTTNLVTRAYNTDPSYFNDRRVAESKHPSWITSGSSWLRVTPFGIRRLVNWIRRQYGDVPIYITENGLSDRNASLSDEHRVYFYRNYINELLKAINLDGVNVRGYTAWSLMDNFEWARGYSEKFGLYSVDMTDPNRPRTPKASARFYRDVIKDHGFIHGSRTDPTVKTYQATDQDIMYGTFPEDFMLGVATSAYQVEGKGNSTWDVFVRTPGLVSGGATGDVAANSYRYYLKDVGAAVQIKADHYYFSLSWTRLLSTSNADEFSAAGLDYYNNLLDALLSSGITPVVALHHWDLPQQLQETDGWLNDETADSFVHFARLCFTHFGDRVKTWITLSEPDMLALNGYELGIHAPGKHQPGTAMYTAGHVMLKAHARVYRMYQQEFRDHQQGHVGMELRPDWVVPMDERDPGDATAVDTALDFTFGLFSDPVFHGDYSDTAKQRVGGALPVFTDSEKDMLKGSADFYGLSYAGFGKVKTLRDSQAAGYTAHRGVMYTPGDWRVDGMWGLRPLLTELHKRYDVPILVTANGLALPDDTLDDQDRVDYIMYHVDEILKAIRLDNCSVTGYTYRSLVDGFEWEKGYSVRSGLFRVDFTDPFRPRAARMSAQYFRRLAEDNGILRKASPSTPPGTAPTSGVTSSTGDSDGTSGSTNNNNNQCPPVTPGPSGSATRPVWGYITSCAGLLILLAHQLL
ncbi:hypothetical protein BaRGS_00009686, partial [Batillaria attramentaria]